MAYTNPTTLQFQQQFARDFTYGSNPKTSVTLNDINYAFSMANVNINSDLFASQADYTMGYNLLAAHYLVTNIRASGQGLNGQFNFLQSGKGVGSVSESFSIPQRILDNPYWSMLTKTQYGAQYLSLILPQMVGQVFTVLGTTRA